MSIFCRTLAACYMLLEMASFLLYKYTEKQGNIKRCGIVLVAMLLVFLSFPTKALAQTFNPLISMSVESCTLDEALDKLFQEYELNVAFSKAELSKIKIDRYSCSYKPIEEVLSDLLKGTDYGFKRIGKQYVIRRNSQLYTPQAPPTQEPKVQPDDPPKTVVQHKVDTVVNKTSDTIRIFDTVQIIRTVTHYDTVVRHEKVVEKDTVYQVKYKGLEIPWPKFKDNGWFINPYLGFGFDRLDYSLRDEDASVVIDPSSEIVAGLDGGYKRNRWSVGMSLSYRSVKYRFLLNEVVYDGDYYVNDTLDMYYVVHPEGDTSYQYILDSTYIPLTTTHYSYRDMNQLGYLGVGVFATFDFWKNNHIRMFLKSGAQIDFLVSYAGSFSTEEMPFYAPITREQAAPYKFSYYAGLGAAFKLVNRVELVPEVSYHWTSGSLYAAEFPYALKKQAWQLKLGLTYYF